ncbi:MAG: hypothetical protein ACYS9X_12310 [Planctomycetota bacterium]
MRHLEPTISRRPSRETDFAASISLWMFAGAKVGCFHQSAASFATSTMTLRKPVARSQSATRSTIPGTRAGSMRRACFT